MGVFLLWGLREKGVVAKEDNQSGSVLIDRPGLQIPSQDASDLINMSIQLCTGVRW